jgi:uncharacterized protein
MPTRTCIACRRKGEPESFFRIAWNESLGWEWHDRRGSAGRSAYICRSEACVAKAVEKERLTRALKKPVPEEARARLKDELLCKLR